jgi:antirestriction protein ArdC
MSATKTFNGLNGTIATRESLIELQEKAKAEKNTEVYKRVSKLLEAYPDEAKFKLEIDVFVEEKKTISISLKTKKKGEELHYFQNETKVASVNLHGVITWHKKGIDSRNRAKIRKDAKIIGLNAPQIDCTAEMLNGIEEETPDHEQIYGLGKSVSPNDIYDMVTSRMLDLIKAANKGDYKRAWNDEGYLIAYNFISKKAYRGINSFMLTPLFGTLDNPYYLTFAQIQQKGGKLKKGSKGHEVVYFSKSQTEYSDAEIERINKAAGKDQVQKGDKKEFFFLKYYNVFSGSDIEGIDFDLDNFKLLGKVSNGLEAGKNETIEIAEKIIQNYPKPSPTIEFKGNKAFFSPSKDLVSLPPIDKFKTSQDFYRTYFHELSHSTGHENRLKRDLSGGFGSPEYAFEELTAEFGAVFLSAQAGIMFYTNKNHAGYLKGWNEVLVPQLENDNRFLMRASSAAQKAADFILQPDSNGVFAFMKKEISKSKVQKKTKETVKKPAAKKKTPAKTAIKPVSKVQRKTKEPELIGFAIVDNIDGSIVASKKTLPELEIVYQNLDVFIEDMPVLVYEIIKKADKNALGKKVNVSWQKVKVEANGQTALFGALNAPEFEEIETIYTEVQPQPKAVQIYEPVVEIPKQEAKVNLPLNQNSLMYRKQNRTNTEREYYKIENTDISEFLGNIEIKEKDSVAITIAGGQGSGKTSFVFQLINAFAKNYKVGHASIEEHPDSALYENKAERFWNDQAISIVDSPEINSMQDIHDLIERNDVIVIDSFSKLLSMDRKITLDETFRKKYDGKLFIIIYQLTTGNVMRGGSASQFDGDVILFVEKFPNFNDNYVYADKNRYQDRSLDELHYNIASAKLEIPEEEALEFTEEIERI